MLFSAPPAVQRPSSWFTWHSGVLKPGARVLDVACGAGRHAIAAAELGASVVAVDGDAARLKTARKAAQHRGLNIEWVEADLSRYSLGQCDFDVVTIFNYLDRARMPMFAAAVRPGGHLMMETFLESQRQLGWGPTSDAHLLRPGELPTLFDPLEVVISREALDFLDGRPMAVASGLAQRVGQ